MRAKSFEAIMRDKARQRIADLRRARRTPRAALAYQSRYGLADGSKGRMINLPEVFEAMAQSDRE
jgi:hypothetical protein